MRIVPFILAAALVLASCSTSPASSPGDTTSAVQDPAVTETILTTSPAIETLPPAGEESQAQTAQPEAGIPSSGTVTYRIVPEESTITYEVGETFFNQNNRFNTAVGMTNGVTGEIFVDPQNPLASSLGPITVDISQLTSDSDRRDNAIRTRFLQSSQFPTVTFVPNEVSNLPESYTPGDPISFQVAGDLTIRDVTLPAVFQVNGSLTDDSITGTAETSFLMSEFGFGPIEMAGILGTEDEVKIIVEFVARP